MARRRPLVSHLNWPLISLLAGIVIASAIYVLVSVWVHHNPRFTIGELARPRLLDLLIMVWFFWFGSSIGSFLNVVAWRMPRGVSINGFSGCPFCATPIRSYDNIPVFGWLSLRGRCRSCHLPISPRYPIVEALVGLSITLVGFIGIYYAGANLPNHAGDGIHSGPLRMPHITLEGIATTAYHIVAVAGVWALALIRFDGNRLPGRLVQFVFVCAIVPMMVWPQLQVVPWQLKLAEPWGMSGRLSTVFFVIAGTVAACLIARVIGRSACPAADPKIDPLGKDTSRLVDLIIVLALPGVVMGWQALIAISAVAIVSAIILHRLMPRHTGYEWLMVSIPLVMAIHVAFWTDCVNLSFWPAVNHDPWVFLVWLLGILILSTGLTQRAAIPDAGLQSDVAFDDADSDSEESSEDGYGDEEA